MKDNLMFGILELLALVPRVGTAGAGEEPLKEAAI